MSSTTDIETLAKQARRSVRKGDFGQAIELFNRALEIDEERVDLHEGLATACFLAEDYATAVEHFTRVTRLDPRQGKAYVNLGAVYNRMADYNNAVNALRRGIQKERSAQGFYNLGLAHRGLNQLSMAVSAYREALRLDPQMAEAHLNLANVYVDMGNYQQAIICYKAVLELDPDSQRAQDGLAHAEHASGQAKQSISPFGRLVDTEKVRAKSQPRVVRELSDVERLEDRQTVYQLSGDIRSAAQDLRQQVRAELEPALTALNRAVTQAGEAPAAVNKALADYLSAVQESTELRRILQRKVLQLRGHEEKINTPDLGAGR